MATCDVDFIFEESSFEFDPVPLIGKALVLIGKNGDIKACLVWKITRERLKITYFKVFDPEYNCTSIVDEAIRRSKGETFSEIVAYLSEYELAEQICLRDCYFECTKFRDGYKFRRDV